MNRQEMDTVEGAPRNGDYSQRDSSNTLDSIDTALAEIRDQVKDTNTHLSAIRYSCFVISLCCIALTILVYSHK